MSGHKGMHDYPPKVKLEAVRLYLEEGKTKREIKELLGIRDENRIRIWAKKFREYGACVLEAGKRVASRRSLAVRRRLNRMPDM